MKHRITAAIAAAAIALTAAAPVRADSNDALKLALGAVGRRIETEGRRLGRGVAQLARPPYRSRTESLVGIR